MSFRFLDVSFPGFPGLSLSNSNSNPLSKSIRRTGGKGAGYEAGNIVIEYAVVVQ